MALLDRLRKADRRTAAFIRKDRPRVEKLARGGKRVAKGVAKGIDRAEVEPLTSGESFDDDAFVSSDPADEDDFRFI